MDPAVVRGVELVPDLVDQAERRVRGALGRSLARLAVGLCEDESESERGDDDQGRGEIAGRPSHRPPAVRSPGPTASTAVRSAGIAAA